VNGYERVVEAIEERGLRAPSWGRGTMARCPAHDDNRASLKVDPGDDGKPLVYCHAGCDSRDVLEALDLTWKELLTGRGDVALVAQYVYQLENGDPVIRVSRFEDKSFTQEHFEGYGIEGRWVPGVPPDVERPLYQLPLLVAAIDAGRTVYVVEGEKDVDSFAADGIIATCGIGGAGKWRESYTETLARAKQVVVVPDKDDPGRSHAARILAELTQRGVDASLRWGAAGKDYTDHVNAGFTVEDLLTEEPEPELDWAVFKPFDPDAYVPVAEDWLFEPMIPARARVMIHGAAGSLKSIFAMWLAAKLTKQGYKVAYFNLEMGSDRFSKRWKQTDGDARNLRAFGHLSMENTKMLDIMRQGLKDHALVVVDSWTAAMPRGISNDTVAELDVEYFQPLIEDTGATLLLLDNTGHDVHTDEGVFKMDHARGASAKRDKMDIEYHLSRPDEADLYRTRIKSTKLRDGGIYITEDIYTPPNRIEFYRKKEGTLLWRDDVLNGEEADVNTDDMTVEDRLAYAQLTDKLKPLGIQEVDDAEDTPVATTEHEEGSPPEDKPLSVRDAIAARGVDGGAHGDVQEGEEG
jgi:5S rRNA maturation endonuclease (ribonuclease M5)